MKSLVKELQELNKDVGNIELPKEKLETILLQPKEYAEDFAERMIVKYIPLFIKARKMGEKFAEKIIDREN